MEKAGFSSRPVATVLSDRLGIWAYVPEGLDPSVEPSSGKILELPSTSALENYNLFWL